MCLPGVVVASWCPTQEVVGSSPFTVMKHLGKTPMFSTLCITGKLELDLAHMAEVFLLCEIRGSS